MANFVMMLVGIVLTMIGLLMAAQAVDGMFAFAGAVLAAFGVLFSFSLIRNLVD